MIDWLDVVVGVNHEPLNSGRLLCLKPTGEVEYDYAKFSPVRGSYDHAIHCRSQGGDGSGHATELYLSGNPAKFVQGHNVYGSEDIASLLAETLRRVFAEVGINDDVAIARVQRGHFQVKRIDITRSFALSNRSEVKAVLAALAIKARSRMGRAQSRGGTIYFGKNSTRHSIKCYSKGDELEAGKKHRLPDQLKDTPIQKFADNLLRVELTLRARELRDREITEGHQFTLDQVDALFRDYFGRIEMSSQIDIASDVIKEMPRAIRSTYLLWKEGIDVRNMSTEATFYRHRKQLLGYGVDIMLPREDSDCRIIPLFRTVSASPARVPNWAFDQGLVFGDRESVL